MPRTASAASAAASSTVPARPWRSALSDRALETAAAVRPRLAVVARPDPRRSSVPFTLLCSLIIAATLLAVLLLNISMSNTSYQISSLHHESQRLTQRAQALGEEKERLGTPQELERRATELGMVPAQTPAYIDLASGTVVGEPQPAEGAAQPAPAVPAAQIYDTDPYWGMGDGGR